MIKDPVQEIGALIKAAREQQALSLEDLASQSRVAVHHIENIENVNREKLPEDAYLVGFLTKILKTLGFHDVNAMITKFKKQEGEFIVQTLINIDDAEVEELVAAKESGVQQFKIYHLYILFAIFLILITWSMLNNGSKEKTIITSEQLSQNDEGTFLNKKKLPQINEKQLLTNEDEGMTATDAGLEAAPVDGEFTEDSLETISYRHTLNKGEGDKNIFIRIKEVAWFQVIGVDSKKILYEGDVAPSREPNQFNFKDDKGFVIATGNAGAFEVNTGSGPFLLGQSGQLIKWYYPDRVKKTYQNWSKRRRKRIHRRKRD